MDERLPIGRMRPVTCATPINRRGFTLLELMLVVAIIGLMLSLAAPQLWGALAGQNLEGTARHLGNYGRALMAQSSLLGEPLILKIDFKKQEYWTIRPQQQLDDDFFEEGAKGAAEPATDLFAPSSDPTQEDMDAKIVAMRQRMDQLARLNLDARARNVPQEGMLDEIGPLFEEEFSLRKKEEGDPQEYKTGLINHTWLPEEIQIESVMYGTSKKTVNAGIAEVEVLPLGLAEKMFFYLKDEDGQYFTVVLDPITTGMRLIEGKHTES